MERVDERRLYVAWRRPDGLIVPVGCLTERAAKRAGTTFSFVYLKAAELEADFVPLPGLPDLHRCYGSDELFPVFANRVMPRERPDYGAFVEHLDLTVEADPFEVLGRSDGVRVTDRIEVFAAPERNDAGDLTTLFFARGIRHLPGASETAATLEVGDALQLEHEEDNPVTSRALLLNTRTHEAVGWVPHYLLDLFADIELINGAGPRVTVAHVNPPSVGPHLRVLCRAEAPWPDQYQPFSGPQFQPLAAVS